MAIDPAPAPSSPNPVSPKVYAAGIGVVASQLIFEVLAVLLPLIPGIADALPSPWDGILRGAAAVAGALVGAYLKKDPLRVPTLDQAAVNRLPDPVE